MRKFFKLFFILYSFTVNSQVLKVYNPSIDTDEDPLTDSPNLIPRYNTNNGTTMDDILYKNQFKIGHNNDFIVKVKKSNSSIWENLFEYNTFVNIGSSLSTNSNSSFVSFDFEGSVDIEIICLNITNISDVTIRPLSKNVTPNIDYLNKKITFTIQNPSKYSVEVNNDRYRNLQIFANPITTYDIPENPTLIYNSGIHIYDVTNNNLAGKKIRILEGATVIIPYTNNYTPDNGKLILNDNDDLYIENGGVLKGGVIMSDKSNVKVYGGGIIDLSNHPKQLGNYINNYAYINGITIRRSNNITIDGITINDPQQVCIELTDSDNISINNVNTFSRVLWGDGFHMKGTSNVNINNCYIRTSDDCIAIYASRKNNYDTYLNRDAINIRVTNTLLYADKAHPIEIGWHGNQDIGDNGKNIYNIVFNNIDILEHDEVWSDYMGAIAINCSDGNKCNNISFKNINIEDFTSGSLLRVNVEPAAYGSAKTNGKTVKNIKFENIIYNGNGEQASTITGIDCERYVNGVHFENLVINSQVIKKLSDYSSTSGDEMFKTNDFAYNITFQEGNNYSLSLQSGIYYIKNISTNKYIQDNSIYSSYLNTDYYQPNNATQIWDIQNLETGHYRIKNISTNNFLESSDIIAIDCNSRHVLNSPQWSTTKQEWKIVGNHSTGYYINNAFTKSYLYNSNTTEDYVTIVPKNEHSDNRQKWMIITPIEPLDNNLLSKKTINDKDIQVLPNPFNDHIRLNNVFNPKNTTIKIIDLQGRIVFSQQVFDINSIFFTDIISNGIYTIVVQENDHTIFKEKLIKN